MILKSFDFQCDFDFQITTSKVILILILNHLYLGDLILILKSSTYDDFAHLWQWVWIKFQVFNEYRLKMRRTEECIRLIDIIRRNFEANQKYPPESKTKLLNIAFMIDSLVLIDIPIKLNCYWN